MARLTSENLLISCLVNSADIHLARRLGCVPSDFKGYRDEYQWVLDHYEKYDRCPNEAELLAVFEDFPFSPSQEQARSHADEVLRQASSRNLLKALNKAQSDLLHGDVYEAFEHFKTLQMRVAAFQGDNLLVDSAFLDDYDAPQELRVTMPWPTLQQFTGGIGPGELWYIGARQGHGKSSYLVDIAVAAAMQGYRVNIFSLEMTKRQIQVRAQAACGKALGLTVNSAMMLHRQFDQLDYKTLLQKIEAGVPGTIHVNDASKGRVTPSVVAASTNDYDLTIIDYVGLMYSDDGLPAIRDHRVMAEISNQLKEIALVNGTRIIGASQINREGDSNGYKPRPPKLKTLAQSDHLGNDGDLVATMCRMGLGVGVFSIEKNRHGESGRLFYTKFDPNHGDFTEVTEEQARDIADCED